MQSVCLQWKDNVPGAQTGRLGAARPGRTLLGGMTSPAALLFSFLTPFVGLTLPLLGGGAAGADLSPSTISLSLVHRSGRRSLPAGLEFSVIALQTAEGRGQFLGPFLQDLFGVLMD